nr:unnamed protein product [Callosobruchus analis]
MTPQLLVPNPKNTRLLYCKSRDKIRFPVYSGWCTDGAFRVATIIGGSKSVTKGMTPQLLVPNPKITRLILQIKSENSISGLIRLFKICDKGDDTPASSPESKKIRDSNIASQELKLDFRFIPAGAQKGLSG